MNVLSIKHQIEHSDGFFSYFTRMVLIASIVHTRRSLVTSVCCLRSENFCSYTDLEMQTA